jgi:hypothetical protein
MVISDVYSIPNRGMTAAYVLGFAGWAVGAAGTIIHLRQNFQATTAVLALAIAGWAIGAWIALPVGFAWLKVWEPGFWGPIVSTAIGGAIGGSMTLPMRSLSPAAVVARNSALGALNWGGSFLIFQALAFYAGYILVQLTVNPLLPLLGHEAAKVPGWALPAGLAGLAAGRLASRFLQARGTGAKSSLDGA